MGRPTLRRIGLQLDPPLTIALMLVCLLGLAVLFSASGQSEQTVVKQSVRLLIGVIVMLGMAALPIPLLRTWAPWLYLLAISLLVAVWLLGEGRGAQRWLNLGVVRFQPSELTKLALPIMVAWLIQHRPQPIGWRELGMAAVIIGIPVLLIARQPDLGTALLVAASGFFVLYFAGLRWRVLASITFLGMITAPVLWYVMHEYQRDRVRTFLDPERDPLGSGWNIIQSKIAIGSGGLSGKGWLNGTQSHLEFLPERSTDFILAVLSEEFGLTGVISLLGLYLFIITRSLQICVTSRDNFGRLLGGTISATFFVYVFVNFGMVSGILPVVGVPLPLVSYGGTSAVTLFAGFGILMSIHAHKSLLRD